MEAVLLTHGMKLRGGGYSTTSTLPDGSPGRRIALAITGQLMRTELASKVHNFVEPNRAHGVDTVMFLALMDRQPKALSLVRLCTFQTSEEYLLATDRLQGGVGRAAA